MRCTFVIPASEVFRASGPFAAVRCDDESGDGEDGAAAASADAAYWRVLRGGV